MKQHTFAKWFLAIAFAHLVVGVFTLRQGWWEIIQAGWINVAGPNNIYAAVTVWISIFTIPMMMVVSSLWNRNEPTPGAVVWIGILGATFGISLMPVSGFWLVLVLCALALIPSNARSKKVGANSLDSRFI